MPVEPAIRASLEARKLRVAGVAIGVMVVVGVVMTPRFDYSVRKEIMWSDTVKGFVEKEAALLSRQNVELSRWQSPGS